jgi:Fe-S cluster assembly iron-binding protein IscA
MLTLTPTASDAVRLLVETLPVDRRTGGLRIGRAAGAPEGMAFDMEIVDGPQAHDERIEAGGALVFLAPRAAEFLDGQTLHAQFETGRVRFVVVDREAPA